LSQRFGGAVGGGLGGAAANAGRAMVLLSLLDNGTVPEADDNANARQINIERRVEEWRNQRRQDDNERRWWQPLRESQQPGAFQRAMMQGLQDSGLNRNQAGEAMRRLPVIGENGLMTADDPNNTRVQRNLAQAASRTPVNENRASAIGLRRPPIATGFQSQQYDIFGLHDVIQREAVRDEMQREQHQQNMDQLRLLVAAMDRIDAQLQRLPAAAGF
jgi:hypothetical protein